MFKPTKKFYQPQSQLHVFSKNLTPEEKLRLLNESEKRRASWAVSAEQFASKLTELRNTPPALSAEEGLINESSGKYVWKITYGTSAGPAEAAYKTNPGKTPWRYIFKSSLPVREARNYFLFETLGIPVAPVIAVGDLRKNFLLQETFIATEYLENTQDGRQFMPRGSCRSQREKMLLFCRLNMELLAKLHHAGVFHKAFHPRNLLWREKGEKMEIFWIDVARCRKVFPFQMPWAVIKDLHTFFRDMRLTEKETLELLNFYASLAPAAYLPGTGEELLDKLRRFRRRLFSRKRYSLFEEA